MVREPMQRGSDIIMSSIPLKWREQATQRVSKAEGVIRKMTSDITTEDWSLQHCQDYLVELEMVTSGALMALRLTANDISSEQVSQQAEHLGSRAREAKNMALDLRRSIWMRSCRSKTGQPGYARRLWEEPPALAQAGGEVTVVHDSPVGWKI
jgi:hypothetical protein